MKYKRHFQILKINRRRRRSAGLVKVLRRLIYPRSVAEAQGQLPQLPPVNNNVLAKRQSSNKVQQFKPEVIVLREEILTYIAKKMHSLCLVGLVFHLGLGGHKIFFIWKVNQRNLKKKKNFPNLSFNLCEKVIYDFTYPVSFALFEFKLWVVLKIPTFLFERQCKE